MELKEYLQVLYRWVWLLVLGTLAAMVSSYLVFRYYTPWPPYEATATVMIGDDTLGLDTVQAIRATYAELAGRRPVSQAVVYTLGLPMSADDLEKLVKVNPVGYTRLLEISVTYNNAQQAANIANEVARQLGLTSSSSQTTLVRTIAEAQVPTHPGLDPYIGTLIAGITGFSLATGAAILIEYLGGRIRTPQDVERSLRLTVLGTVEYPSSTRRGSVFRLLRRYRKQRQPEGGEEKTQEISTTLPPSVSETHRWICFRLCHLESGAPQKLLITSPDVLVGQSTLAAGLATAWAETDQKVVLVNAPPLSSRSSTPAASRQQRDALDNDTLDDLSRQADVVIVDGPPVLATPNTAVLASRVDGILLVLGIGKTRIKATQETVKILEAVGGKVLGAILLS